MDEARAGIATDVTGVWLQAAGGGSCKRTIVVQRKTRGAWHGFCVLGLGHGTPYGKGGRRGGAEEGLDWGSDVYRGMASEGGYVRAPTPPLLKRVQGVHERMGQAGFSIRSELHRRASTEGV
jgi:hypothetical protein